MALATESMFMQTSTLSLEVNAAIISAAALIFVAVTGSALSRYFDRKQQIEQEQRQRKAEVYIEFLEYWFWVMRESRKASSEKRSYKEFKYRTHIPQKLVVWGSEPFIKRYGS